MGRRSGRAVVALALLAGAGQDCHRQTVTAPSLSTACAASPASGTAPLSVTFTLNVAGAVGSFAVAVDYGDGTSSNDASQSHVYRSSGTFSPGFTVTTPTQSARCSTIVTVAAPLPTPPATNQPPDAVFITHPGATGGTLSGRAPMTVDFNICRTADPEGDKLLFEMDLDGDGVFEFEGSTGADCRHGATYTVGTHVAKICVTDVDCTTWPSCLGTLLLHPLQCRVYSVVASP